MNSPERKLLNAAEMSIERQAELTLWAKEDALNFIQNLPNNLQGFNFAPQLEELEYVKETIFEHALGVFFKSRNITTEQDKSFYKGIFAININNPLIAARHELKKSEIN